ncbi:ABC transporter ATP-binding protein [Halobacillus sp. A5]|uniref:ATP-binding cassette domain-containing protein n=1 Tax=Halobacillus sp. A5 TaxID=2880263 RepID=UPI0020A6391D|nr:ABC transporter ATP-binding protein [Halobacillus sp. A5]MCP3029626.1 ABC transporter ATP-binding protein [Halobacillus sp. A5]
MTYIKVQGLMKSFGSKRILEYLDLEVDTPSIVAVIGNNGTGKSVFLNCLLNYMDADKGEINLLGHSNKDQIFVRKNTAFISSDHQLHLEKLTPKEYFDLIISIYDLQPELGEEMYTKYMKELNLIKDLQTSFKSLSFGSKKKVQLVGSLLFQPEVLVCDEIFEGLDFDAVEWVKQLFEERKMQGKVTLFTSHIIDYVKDISDVIYILKEGKLVSPHQTTKREVDQYEV